LKAAPPGAGQPNRVEQVEIAIASSTEAFNAQLNDPTDPTLHSNRGWMRSMYLSLFGRDPDPVPGNNADAGYFGLLNNLLTDYQGQRVATTAALTSSVEYQSNLVSSYFVKYLHRVAPPGQGEIAPWVASIRSGSTDEQIIAILSSSDEAWIHAALNNTLGNDPQPTFQANKRWINQIYQDVLGRTGNSTEPGPNFDQGARSFLDYLNAHSANLDQNRAARLQIAGMLPGSTEALNILVAGFYTKYLKRTTSDPMGIAGWVNLIQHGIRDEQVINALFSTTEYFLLPHTIP
jgi:hypothetical protein